MRSKQQLDKTLKITFTSPSNTVAHKCHGKRKKLPPKEKHPRQKKNVRGKKEIGHGKRKKLPAKEKHPRQKKNARGKKEIGHGKRKKLAAKGKLLQQKKVTHRKRQKNTTKSHEKNISRNKILRKEKKKQFLQICLDY